MAGVRVKVTGSEQLTRISKVLKDRGDSKSLKRRMAKAFKSAAEPITRGQRENLSTRLPRRGGAAAAIGGEARTIVRTGWGGATVDILDSWPGHDIKAIERGVLRHPVFKTGKWAVTTVEPLLLATPFLEHKLLVVAELAKEMDLLAEEIARET